jgi:mono/diheme cytochrome c family protein
MLGKVSAARATRRASFGRLQALVLALAAAACGGDEVGKQWPISKRELAAEPSGTNAGGGEVTYQRYCVGCHGSDGRANGGTTGADFTGPQSPLLTRADAELAVSVRDGKRGERASMPAHSPILNDAQITAVIAYVRTRFASDAGARP